MDDRARMIVQPLVHVEDMSASVAFYEALGAIVVNGSRDGDFVLLALGGTQLGLLAHPPNPEQGEQAVELTFEAADLDALTAAVAAPASMSSAPSRSSVSADRCSYARRAAC